MPFTDHPYTGSNSESVSWKVYAPLPPLPRQSHPDEPSSDSFHAVSPVARFADHAPLFRNRSGTETSVSGVHELHEYDHRASVTGGTIPPYSKYPKNSSIEAIPLDEQQLEDLDPEITPRTPHKKPREKRRRKEPFFSRHTPWVVYVLTLVQTIVFLAEVIKNAILTGSPIEIHPSFNPMIGPSPYVLINMGARYVPCMRNEDGIQNNNNTILWPCPNQTDNRPTCTLSQLCGFNGVPPVQLNGSLDAKPAPDQWFRFITPIFIHAGLVHISFNMLLQILLGSDVEKAIGHPRFALVYFSCGIFGFVMGGNYAQSGTASTGASGSLFGVIAIVLLDLLYTWSSHRSPWKDLLFICLDIVVSFVLGLLPGVDNFSHIGGFLMGIVLGICLLHSPAALRKRTAPETTADAIYNPHYKASSSASIEPNASTDYILAATAPTTLPLSDPEISVRPRKRSKAEPITGLMSTAIPSASLTHIFAHPRTFFSNRHPLWWAWWLLRAAALAGVISFFIVLLRNFYTYHAPTCSWCKYLSCINVNNWCDIGNLDFQPQNATSVP